MDEEMKKRMLLTGATSGIGRYLAEHFLRAGFTLYLHGRDRRKLERLAKKLGPGDFVLLEGDFGNPASIARMFAELTDKTKVLDVLINNAFGKLESELVQTDGDALAEFFRVSLAGTADVIRQAIPLLKRSKSPRIVNIVADWGFPMHNIMTGPSAYIAAKYGVHGLGVALQTELAKLGIRTTNLCPGIVAADTEFGITDKAFAEAKGQSAINPKELASAIEFVLGQTSTHVRSIVLSPRNPEYNGL
jgi:NAD(P)-dependent dehydrogenase (short-subunit alcohol dehydrogenase family)